MGILSFSQQPQIETLAVRNIWNRLQEHLEDEVAVTHKTQDGGSSIWLYSPSSLPHPVMHARFFSVIKNLFQADLFTSSHLKLRNH